MFDRLQAAFLNRMFRNTFRTMCIGLLAGGYAELEDDEALLDRAENLTKAALERFRKNEV
jgi:hypothetical protein